MMIAAEARVGYDIIGIAVMITMTWGPSGYRAVRENAGSGEWQLILAIFLVSFVVLCQQSYVIVFNWAGRPESWATSALSGFWPYSYVIAGMLFLAAPGVKGEVIEGRAIWPWSLPWRSARL